MSGKDRKDQPAPPAPAAEPASEPIVVPVPVPAKSPLSARQVARIECLKVAMEKRTPSTQSDTVIAEARKFEAYVMEGEDQHDDAETA